MKVTINLLPKDKKNEIQTQRTAGVVLKIGLSAAFAVVVFAVFLGACLFIINIQKSVAQEEAQKMSEVKVYSEIQQFREVVEKYYGQVQEIDEYLDNEKSYVGLLEKINEILPREVFLQEISIDEEAMEISGHSRTREALIEFRDRLEEEEFGKIDAPISNFTASKDINFIFTINFNKEKQ